MIQVNLLKPKIASENVVVEGVSEESLLRKGFGNLAFVLIGPLSIYFYINFYSIPEKQNKIQGLQRQISELKTVNDKAKSAVADMKKFESDTAKLRARIDSIDDLRKDRMHEVRVLDLIQREIPEHLWLTKIDVTDDQISIVGQATNENEITQFMDSLTKSGLLGTVNLISSAERNSETGFVKEFEIRCPKYPQSAPIVPETAKPAGAWYLPIHPISEVHS